MVTIGVDPHKETHSAVAADPLGREISKRTEAAVHDGFGRLMAWARELDHEHVWVLEDCRHVSGPFERFLIDHGESVVRLPPRLMAGARDSVREPGKSDPIDALAIARAALREGIETLPTARLAGAELEIRLLCVHRQRLVDARTRLANQLRWELHDLWPGWDTSRARLRSPATQQQIARRLSRAEPTVRVRIARDIIRRIRELTRTIDQLHQQLAELVATVAPQLLAENGLWARKFELAPVWTLEVAPPPSDRLLTVSGSLSSSGRRRKGWVLAWSCSSRSEGITIGRGCRSGR
jgi:transposase